ncbi:MAG: KpsF/GutQ family sugar-phosphate isomerase [Neisseria sp.]|uniref:KpsF/GutQ family sugar-phosphate isomerase n=1 Tax=Neisseria sp. TaxID=192066 RepID=UPI0026DB1286|nr:KpsF/GutQ family sugar-phosphate isomerase [Neisseria sp.]MDO4641431.1 KpsF/GutQ family sugar-phosphate isomerase [Neisseria sp.]
MQNNQQSYIGWAREVLQTEAESLLEVAASLDNHFIEAIDAILACTGRVVVSGVGKSGHICRKIAATLASTGTPAFFVHPAEAAHGDLGMIVDGDVVIAVSNSGESDEIVTLLPALKRKKITLVCITANPDSTLAKNADVHITASVSKEACPLGLAPTSSSTAALALGDALAVALLRARSFTPDDFALSHPAGRLGKRLLMRVADIMRTGERLPIAGLETTLREGILTMSAKGLGMVVVTDDEHKLLGVFTDGDLRRVFEKCEQVSAITLGEVMNQNPKTISAEKLATEALKNMQEQKISSLLVIDEAGKLQGAVSMHDLLLARIA